MLVHYSSRKAVWKIKTRFPFVTCMITRYWGIVLVHIHCVQELTDREKSRYAEHEFAWTRLELFASQLPVLQCLSVIWKLVEFRKRHRFEASVVFFSSLFWSPPVKMPFQFYTCSAGTELLSQWMLSDPSRSFHSVFEASRLCAGTILLHTLPEWIVKMFLTHSAMEEMLCPTSWKYS